MLNTNYIVKGQKRKYDIPEGSSFGAHMINCIKKRNPHDVFAIDGLTGDETTCDKILEQVFKTVSVLKNLGVNSGDVIALISENTIMYCSTFIALTYMGAPANLLNPVYTAGELERALSITKPKYIIASKNAYRNLKNVINHVLLNCIILLEEVSTPEIVSGTKVVFLEKLLANTQLDMKKIQPAEIDGKNHVIAILLSSGTTGLPKSLMLTHENCINSVTFFNDPHLVGVSSKDTAIAVLPFCHVYGVSLINLAALYSLKLVVFPSFIPETYLQSIEKYKVSLVWAIPALLSFLIKHPLTNKYNLTSLRYATCSGGYLSTQIKTQILARYPKMHIVQIYGLTELCGAATLHSCYNLDNIESVGKLSPNLEAMVWSSELCKNVGPMEIGELCFRGPMVMKGYMNEAAKVFDEHGFYHSGDLGYYNQDGYFYLIGRCKELIKYKGFQVAPAEIEEILLSHKEIVNCAVIGVPNERVGQLPAALIVLKPKADVTEQDIIQFVAERISNHKQLHGGVKFVQTIPKSPTGKIIKDGLLELYQS